jgi:hypothetical protein
MHLELPSTALKSFKDFLKHYLMIALSIQADVLAHLRDTLEQDIKTSASNADIEKLVLTQLFSSNFNLR